MPRTPPPYDDDDPLAAFELPPEIMSQTLEHAIGDDATVSHELGHAVASRLQQALKGSTVEYGFGSLVRGVAYVQFCLVSDEGELLISETRWVAVI